ncbi:MAG: hypothetical protein ACE5FT_00130 [Candidatus Nanoarchaeia archaeon]
MDRRFTLLLLVLVVLGTRLVFAGQHMELYGDESYYHIRQVDHIRDTGMPLREDPLSFGGRINVLSPAFDYLLAAFTYILPVQVAFKLVPNLFGVLFVVISYFIAWRITRNSHVSFLTAALSGFLPIYFAKTFNHVTVYGIVVPLMALLIYFYMDIEKHVAGYVITLILLSLLHASILVFICGLLVYALIVNVEGMKLTEKEKEIILFSVVFALWSQFVLYKNVFLVHSTLSIWQNLPEALLSNYFEDFSILEAIYKIDAVPFLFGLYAMRQYLFKVGDKKIHFLIGMALAIALLLWLKLVPLVFGLMLFGMIMTLLFAKSYHYRVNLVRKSRLRKHLKAWQGFFLVFFLITAVGASLHLAVNEVQASTIDDEHEALEWLENNSEEKDIVMSSEVDSQKIMALSNRATVLDSNFLLVPGSDVIYDDMKVALTSPHITQVGERLDKHDVNFVYVSRESRELLGISKLPSVDDKCLPLVYQTSVQIYEWKCKLEVLG